MLSFRRRLLQAGTRSAEIVTEMQLKNAIVRTKYATEIATGIRRNTEIVVTVRRAGADRQGQLLLRRGVP